MLREAYEDYHRHKSDISLNSSSTNCLRNGKIEKILWKDIIVGDLLVILKNEVFPADLIILKSSNPDSSAFINTSSLDGEKNLKPKVILIKIRNQFWNFKR